MRLGLTLPIFSTDPSDYRAVAAVAESAGIDGVFVFDHLWPLGRRDRPALSAFPVLAEVAASTTTVVVGTLVARVGLRDDDDLFAAFSTVGRIAGPGRVIAGLGTGDHRSKAENLAYGVAFDAAAERVARMARTAERLRAAGFTVWVGGRSAGVREAAAVHADALNVWGAAPEQLAAEAADLRSRAGPRPVQVTWGGPVDPAGDAVGELRCLDQAAGGLSWIVAALGPDVGQHLERVKNLAEVRAALAVG